MPHLLFILLMLPILLDVWLTILMAHALSLPLWVVFLVPTGVGMLLLILEWKKARAQFQALRQLQGSPLSLLASARRAFAALLLILPGVISDIFAILILLLGAFKANPAPASPLYSDHKEESIYSGESVRRTPSSPQTIEGDFRRE
ncbi:MAG: FxsA family protein [Burkholderiales bacterium]|jgi:UPF0716 family protein affecting phage T7 exclusion|nr:FxsA family protein [Burkholderiales bacterium]